MNPFRSSNGQRLLRGLFYEEVNADKSLVVYTLKDRDHAGFPSLYRLYMEADDPTEYTFAIANLDGWEHWEMLCNASWFKPYVTRWRRELEIRARARALQHIKAVAESDTKEAYQANKFLVTGGWKNDKRKGAGRPSKEEVSKAAKAMAEEAKDLNDDLARVQGLVN